MIDLSWAYLDPCFLENKLDKEKTETYTSVWSCIFLSSEYREADGESI